MNNFEQIVQKMAPQSKLLRVWPLKGGISAEMTAVKLQHANGRIQKIIIRQHGQDRHTAENEYKLLQELQSQGLAAPTPYLLDQSGQILDEPYLVIDYIEGQMEFAPADLDSHIRQLAAQLAQIHQVDVTNLTFLPQNVDGCAELQRTRPKTSTQSSNEVHIRDRLATHNSLHRGNAPALLHGDFWPGNSLWQDGKLTAVIDWEDAELGDPLADLAKSRSEIVWIFGIDAMNSFTHHYQSKMDLDYTHLPYWDLCAALRSLRLINSNLAEIVTYFAEFGRADITEQTIRDNSQYFINQAMAA